MELEGNPGSALREAIGALDGMTAQMVQGNMPAHLARKAMALHKLRRFNDLLTRAQAALDDCDCDLGQHRLATEIFAFLNIAGDDQADDQADNQADEDSSYQRYQDRREELRKSQGDTE